jgi:large subunit ribosomal protein L20
MANWSKKKVFKLAKGFFGRSKNCWTLAIRRVHKSMQKAYRGRKMKKRNMSRERISHVNIAAREHGIPYSRVIAALNRSNLLLDRKVLEELANNEPYSFKSVVDELDQYVTMPEMKRTMEHVSYGEAFRKEFLSRAPMDKIKEKNDAVLKHNQSFEVRQYEMVKITDPSIVTEENDPLRISFREEDDAWREEQMRKRLTDKEMKKIPKPVLDDNWQEDMSLYEEKMRKKKD